jgi:hypothetical protein
MKNKNLILWCGLLFFLFVGCCVVIIYWFEIIQDLKNPCRECVKENPDLTECIFRPVPNYNIKINFSGEVNLPPF